MKTKLNCLILLSLTLFLNNCLENAKVNANDVDSNMNISNSVNIGSYNNINLNKLSGDYKISNDGMRFSKECTSEFLLAHDFFIDRSLSKEEVEERLENGYPPETSVGEIIIDDGEIIMVSTSTDGEDLEGNIDSNGKYHASARETIDNDEYEITTTGQCLNGNISGAMRVTFKVTSSEPTGECSLTTNFSGRRLED